MDLNETFPAPKEVEGMVSDSGEFGNSEDLYYL